MKYIIILILVFIGFNNLAVTAQRRSKDSIAKKQDAIPYYLIEISKINGLDVLNTDTLYNMLAPLIEKNKKRINYSDTYPRVFITNGNSSQYLKIWGAPDIGFRKFYTIGYTGSGAGNNNGCFLGKQEASAFVINKGVQLGMDIADVASKMYLVYFRNFRYKGITYYYLEKDTLMSIPFTPKYMYYFKFKKDKLIEIGFGRGFENLNPMLQPEEER